MTNGQVEFRSAAGQPHSVAIDSIKQFVLADTRRFADFNEAERLIAGGNPAAAILRYNRARRGLEGFWKDVASSRLIAACDRAGRFEEAVRHFISTVRSQAIGLAVASRLMPIGIPTKRNSQAIRAIEQLDAAIKIRPGPEPTALMVLLRFDIIRQTGDRRLEQAAKRVAALSLPPDLRNERFYKLIYLALTQPVIANNTDRLIGYVDRAILECPASVLPDFLLLKGKTLMGIAKSPDDIIRASWPFMRVAIHMPNDARAAEGLFETARVMEKLNRPTKALELYRECADHPQVAAKLKLQAQAEIARLSTP